MKVQVLSSNRKFFVLGKKNKSLKKPAKEGLPEKGGDSVAGHGEAINLENVLGRPTLITHTLVRSLHQAVMKL